MLRMALALFMTFQANPQQAPRDEISDALAHAEALYYGARFTDSIALLMRVDGTLKTQPGRLQDKITTKLRLALAHIGLNETNKAKTFLMELYTLNPDYILDPQQFSPKVIQVAADAKAEQNKTECQTAQTNARTYMDAGNTAALLDLLRSSRTKCPALAAMQPDAAESFYRSGLAAYRRGENSNALSNFEAAVTLSPEHELALQYIDLLQSKQQVTEDRLLLQWQRDFDAHKFDVAASDYRQILSSINGRNTTTVNYVIGEYRKALSALVENWNRTCPTGDTLTLNSIRTQMSALVPESSFGEDIRNQMMPCGDTNKTSGTKTAVTQTSEVGPKRDSSDDSVKAPGTTTTCLDMQPQLALARLKTRVDPTIPSELRSYLKSTGQVTVHVKVRISGTGDVTVNSVDDSNPVFGNVIRNAVTQWKFSPIRDQNGLRCVDTDIPMVIKLAQ